MLRRHYCLLTAREVGTYNKQMRTQFEMGIEIGTGIRIGIGIGVGMGIPR